MASAEIRAEIKGLKEVQTKAEQVVRDLRGYTLLDGMRRATLIVEGAAKRNLKPWNGAGEGGVNTGRLRASIVPEVRMGGRELSGVVGSNVSYAPDVEFGTPPHYVPSGEMAIWARRHGVNEYAMRAGIAAHGTRAYRYLQRALEDNRDRVNEEIDRTVKAIVEET